MCFDSLYRMPPYEAGYASSCMTRRDRPQSEPPFRKKAPPVLEVPAVFILFRAGQEEFPSGGLSLPESGRLALSTKTRLISLLGVDPKDKDPKKKSDTGRR